LGQSGQVRAVVEQPAAVQVFEGFHCGCGSV
jgi:hypothetical protein